jgi:predicted dehydrogenase
MYVAEIEAFSRAVLSGAPCPIDLADSLRNAALLDAIRTASPPSSEPMAAL